jgi:hypothetical protein
LVLFSYQGSKQRRVESLRRYSDVTDLEIPLGNPEEGSDDEDDIVAPRNLTFTRISLSFSRTEAGQATIAVYSCRYL